MIDRVLQLPPEQQAIRAKCFHPSGTFVEFPNEEVETSIPARFDKMVQQYRDRIAVRTETQVVTFGELDAMAHRFARALLQRQGPKVQLVALLLEKDVAQIAAMLGVMRAGKFFLILDPSFPKARLIAMLQDSRAKLIVTNRQNALLANEIVTGDRQLMKWETIDEAVADGHLRISIAPKALAFINYTSGSTGEPKGLLRTHRMILHNIMSRTNLLHVCPHDRISLLSSGTSNAITNSLLALLNGAGLYSLEVKKEGVARLTRWLVEAKITIAPMSSPLFRSLCETLFGKNNFPDLRIVRLRSEAVYREDADLYKTHFSPGCVFVTGLSSNETGPLRDFLIDHQTDVAGSAVPVGYPVPGKNIFLLDDSGNEVSSGEVGEIAVRSRYLAPGYLRRTQLTKAKFTPDPTGAGKRLYLTGDLGVMLPDGCLVYKGRKDFRIKIRGYGVDLKEVELALRKHPAVADAVVVARENERREKELIGYFTSTLRNRPSESELRSFLGQTLADYMIPSAFVMLDNIPLTPHNKVDRTALPLPAQTRANLASPFVAPRCEVERQLAEIWAEVLGIDRVGIHDKLFDLGGHSLAATRIVSRVTDKFLFQLPLQVFFDSPTVEEMAAVISQNQDVAPKPRELRSQQFSDTAHARPVAPTIDFTPFPKEEVERSVAERFEKIVRMYPDRIAVKTRNEVVTYSELNAMANSLAHAIVARQPPEAEAVAILLEKGARLMAAMLAVLKAGKFFVLLDRSSPKARLAAVLEDSQAGLIISERQYGEVTRHFNNADSNLLEFDSIALHSAEENLGWNISPNALATVNYTSGSTGEPKGVNWAHRNLLHQVMLFTNAYKLSEFDRLLLTTSGTGNAVSIGFLALLNGAALLPFDVQIHGVNRLVNWLLDEKISICWIGSPLFRNICQALSGEDKLSDVRILRLASETSYKSDIELYKRHFSPECLLINGLSSTESGLICLYPVDFKTEIEGQEFPVGYPVEDKEILLLDDAGKKVGVDEVGEIAVRSRYLSPGYWHRPELTADKFKPDPDGGDQRIYLSGDLGLMLPDGCLIHKGRKDFRVKIRGYGVEIAEIEKVLNAHAAVGQAVVVARRKETGEARLIAYYTCTELPAPTVSELRGFLKKQLSDYMVPSTFVMLDAIPLTQSGKVDRRALPDPNNVRPVLASAYVSSRSEIEQKLIAIWENALDVRPVGVNDGFFDLGGDSLSAARVLSQVIKHFQLEVPLQMMFQSPTIADMASVVAQRRGKLSENDTPDQVAASFLVRVSREGLLPLSYSQQRLWFLDQLDPGSFTYNLFSAYRLKGELNVTALEQSFNEILRRHEVLRTVFKSEGGNPVQIVLPVFAIKIPVFDLRGTVSEEDRWTEVRRMSKEEAQRPFNLATGPLLRITLLQLADDECLLLRAMHHIVSDGWSAGVMSHELSEIYEALSVGKPSPLADLPLQYAHYAKWQRRWFVGERLESQLSYWKQQLENIQLLQLPTDRPRPAIQSSRGARQYFVLSEHFSKDLRVLSHRYGVTLFMTLLAAFQTLLHRYSGQTDIVIGSPAAGRTRKEFEELIGFFLNTLVLRLDLSGNPTFGEALSRVREVCLGALSHQELPFEKLVEALHPDRNLGHNPLFQVTFAFQNTPRFPPQLSGISVKELEMETGVARFDLHLFMEEEDGGLKGYFDYNTDLFNADTIERLLGHFQNLLGGIATDPESRISDLPLLTEAERHQLLVEWNDTRRDYPKEKCIHQLFEEQVEKTPDAIALVFEDQRLTYRELNNRANQLAHYLQKLGVGPEVLVGICVERSMEMIAGLLGILKAGGAYVPLDPGYPKERLAFQLKDTKASVLLTQERLLGDLSEHDGRVICLDRDWAEIARESEANPECGATAENLAYVIYTSGSTGKPKGVMIQHRALSNHMLWMQERFPLDAADCVLQKTPFCFDASVWEFFAPIMAGARLTLARPGGHQDGAYLIDTIVNQQVTTLQLVPSMLRTLLAEEGLERCQKLKRVFCGGEALPVELREQFHGRLGGELYNLYGPTEATIDATCALCDRGSLPHAVTIGRPIANTQVYILGPDLQPVPIGVPGELYIGGECLARGYLNRPELTAEKFITHSFEGEPAKRLYKTGDLARYLSDGNIEFQGRIDDQVKIRGYRIELGEIESVLAQHPCVGQSVVAVREDSPGDKRLVAYVVSSQSPSPSIGEFRRYLQQKLPDYMIPSAYVFLDSLPLTPNGKIDRRSLLAPDRNRDELGQVYVAPRSPTEEILAGIWAQLLPVEQVGVHDNFFDLGGHSLLATQVISRVRQSFQVDLPLRCVFEAPTVAGLAARIETARRSEQGLEALPIAPVSRDGDLPLSFAQQRLWFLDQLEPGSTVYNMSRAVRFTGPLNVAALEKSVTEILRRHEVLRTTFRAVDGQPFQSIAPAKPFILAVTDLQHLPETEREAEARRLANEAAHQPFDLAKGPLFRASLLRVGEEDHILLCAIHHVVSDGWSTQIFNKEMGSLYQTFSSGQPSLLPELPIQYADFAVWQRQWLQGEVLETQLSYWKKQLQGAPVLQLPTDRSRPAVQTFHGARQSLVLPKSLTEALKGLSRQEGVTLFMTLLAAFKVLLSRYTGQEDIVVGTPIAGRNRAEIEPLIGFFINTLALRSDLSGDPSFRELLRRVREATLGAYAHQDLPFEKLVEELQAERDLSRTPLFQVFFNMLNLESHRPELGDLTVEHLLLSEPASKFDLTFYARESNEEINLTLVYNADLFCQDRMVEMLHQFRHLLNQIVESTESSIRSYSLVTPSSAHLLPNPAAVLPEPHRESVTSLFVAWAKQSPRQIAVMQGVRAWSYEQLSANADTLARVLVAHKTRPGDVVAVTGPKSFGLVSSMMAVLQCGGVLCSVDPNLPATRQLLMLREAGAKRLLYIGVWRKEDEWMRELSQIDILFVSQNEGRFLPAERIPNLEAVQLPQISQNDAAYIFFTSGTTGVPKAVLGSHKGLSHFLTWQKETFAVGPEDRCAQLTSLSFDVVLRDIFLPLISGSTLCLPNAIEEASSNHVLQWLDGKRITLLHTVPSLAQSWLSSLPPRATLHSLRWVFFAGEPLTDSLVRQWRDAFPDSGQVVNLYGPTETTLAKCFYTVPAEIPSAVQPLGKPLPQTQALVLAENRKLCGIGEPGEIALRTPFRTFGYINAPEEQRKRFVANPYGDSLLDLIYFTGDRGRYLPDGLLEILGRLDDQVKIRGVRVEPEEVTAILSRHPLVRSCLVVARTNDQKESILVAYVAASPGNQLKVAELRSYLRKALPSAAVPSTFVMLDALPLTCNGKVDRQALPAPSQTRPELEETFVAPRSATEDILAGIWADMLKLEQVGVHDNFFDLGGHSLLATQVTSRVREAFQMDLPLRTIFEKPTVEQLAMVIMEKSSERGGGEEMPRILAQVESLSDEEAKNLLNQGAVE